MSANLGKVLAAPHPRDPDAVQPPLADELAALTGQTRAAIVNLATGAYLVAMAAVTMMATAATGVQPGLVVIAIAAAGAVGALVAIRLMRSCLRPADRLGALGIELTDRFDRVLLDALRDPLTGLGNHRAFQEELDRAASMARRHGQPTSLMLIDVDDLKRINDQDGHAAGDDVLRAVSRVILTNSRRTDRAFRLGGDDFAILSTASSLDEALALGRRVLVTALDQERSPGQRSISLTIGISAMPDPSADRQVLFRHADAALYWGKRHGRTDVQVYDPKRHGVADDERPADELALAVDQVVAQRLLAPVYQPVFSLRDGACVGFEGLVRPRDGAAFRNASALFVAAETVSRTTELDVAAVRELAMGARGLGPDQYLAVNLSPRTVEAEAFNPHEILAILARAGIEPRRLVIELTEREAIEDMDRLARNLAVLRRTGARIAADDVGAGNAGLQLLSRIEFDVIKIDLSLVQGGAVLASSRAVLRALIEMAQRRGATTVAEGIETADQLQIVRELGIHVGQGYLLGRPTSRPAAGPVDLAALLAAAEAEPEPAAVSAA